MAGGTTGAVLPVSGIIFRLLLGTCPWTSISWVVLPDASGCGAAWKHASGVSIPPLRGHRVRAVLVLLCGLCWPSELSWLAVECPVLFGGCPGCPGCPVWLAAGCAGCRVRPGLWLIIVSGSLPGPWHMYNVVSTPTLPAVKCPG